MMKLAGFIVVLLAFSSPAFAQKACTQIGCMNGIMFNAAPEYDWKNGQYRIDVALDYKKVACYGELPLHPCSSGPTFRCDDKSVTIHESGCALPDNQHGIAGVHIDADPSKVMISVKRNLKPIITQTVIPQYQTSMPNGPGCEPVCRSASYDLLSAN